MRVTRKRDTPSDVKQELAIITIPPYARMTTADDGHGLLQETKAMIEFFGLDALAVLRVAQLAHGVRHVLPCSDLCHEMLTKRKQVTPRIY